MQNRPIFRAAGVLAVALLAHAGAARAQEFLTLNRNLIAHAAETCQAALPAYETAIRKRPLALTNEGVAPAFVTCSLPRMDGEWLEAPHSMTIHVAAGATAATISCTGVSGWHRVVRSASLQANALGALHWNGDLFDLFHNFNVSCSLPPGTSIIASESLFLEWY